ncbi:hypothetical protein K435DRAFT_860458 [Dendrothele bispora CBS 962.96]|uniref:Uncharacterized protein n=1 Tax=Dendrothele bispora (strain CBS 962.96) TaxID=1314807 RepID=A0A4S8LXT1_DENBC|nr:hypothetical protein K435DRAFT_860458 [Dendrothele bispora CBS 962.96]
MHWPSGYGTLRLNNQCGQTLQGHTQGVTSVAYSPDGRHIVSGSRDNTVRIWDSQTGQPVGQPLQGHTDYVWSVAYSPDGRHIVSGSWDKTVRIWDSQTGQPVGQPLQGHTHHVLSVAYSPDGRHIVSGSSDKTVRIWDSQIGQQNHTDWVQSVEYSLESRSVPISTLSQSDYQETASMLSSSLLQNQSSNFLDSRQILTIPPDAEGTAIKVDWGNFVFGENWTQIWDDDPSHDKHLYNKYLHKSGTQKSAGAGGAGAGAGGTGKVQVLVRVAVPIGVRRALLALSYLHYLIKLPPTSFANLAFKASSALRASGKSCWLMDLDWGWVEPTDPEDNLEPRSPVLCFRHYLHRVSNYRHRRSVTRLICGNLCPTTFRSSPGRCPKPDDIFDLKCCRACRQHYETPEHVLLQCLHVQEIVDLRRKFLSSVNIDPNLERSDSHCFELLKSLLFSWDRNACTSKFVNDVLKLWKDGNNIERDGEDSDDERE